MAADVPTPDLVIKTGRGDVYGASIWLGMPPTYTPLHRDPNPNLFVQLAGRKRVRLLPPDAGREVFESVQRRIGEAASSVFRGEEMMSGREREVLDEAVWGGEALYECDVVAGDGLFIPKGWWHSIKSVGKGMHGSVRSRLLVQVYLVLTRFMSGQLVVSVGVGRSRRQCWPSCVLCGSNDLALDFVPVNALVQLFVHRSYHHDIVAT